MSSRASAIPGELVALGLALACMAGVLWWRARSAVPAGSSIAREAGAAAGGAIVDAGVGIVEGIGEAVGIPRTDQTECQRLIAAGDWWAASFACPAGDFLGAVFSSSESPREGGASGSW